MPLDALYQEIILDHFKNPRNFGKLDGSFTGAHHENPSCGDQLDLQVSLDGQQRIINQIKFYGRGCVISQASASMMTELVKGKTVVEARAAIASFLHMLTGEDEASVALGELEALSGLRQFPMRVKCATLAWKALESCLQPAAVQP
jgi:nitrogen fixation NifU-like protein